MTVPYFGFSNFVFYDNVGFKILFVSGILEGTAVTRKETGDYVIIVYEPPPTPQGSNYGCYQGTCYLLDSWSIDSTIYRLAYSYISKYPDLSTPDPEMDPLKYLLVNSGYDYLIIGVETSQFDPGEKGISDFSHIGELYISKGKEPPASINQAYLKINFTVDYEVNYGIGSHSKVKAATATMYRKDGASWILLKSIPIYYRWYYESEFGYRAKVWDQIVFIIDNDTLSNILELSSGDNVWISGYAKFVIDDTEYSDIYGDIEYSWVKYVYTPLKQIVDSWYEEYFGG